MPSNPNASTICLALWAKFDLTIPLLATAGKGALPSPPPPTERIVLMLGNRFLRDLRSLRHPFTLPSPLMSISVSAYSSLNCSCVSFHAETHFQTTYKQMTLIPYPANFISYNNSSVKRILTMQMHRRCE